MTTAEPAGKAGIMQNRELSWLKFNERVLLEASRTETPLLERLKFIAIFSSNLDEFFMIRVGVLTDYALMDPDYRDNKTGMSAQEQLDEIYRAAAPLYALRDAAFLPVAEGLARRGVHLLNAADLGPGDLAGLEEFFTYNVLPVLSPQIIDTAHPFPLLPNKRLHVSVALKHKKGPLFGLIPVPGELGRLIPLKGDFGRFVFLEDLICRFAGAVFAPREILGKNILAVTRNADLNTDDGLLDGVDYRQHMQALIRKRQRLQPVRLETGLPVVHPEYLGFFLERLGLAPSQVFTAAAPLDFSFLPALERLLDRDAVRLLTWPVHAPAETLSPGVRRDMLDAADAGDLLLSYPFESISPFLEMVRQAAEDPSVLSIKVTLYRIDARSRLADSLIRAAENGKVVVVLMELRARFDEQNNIEWARRLEEAGCRVVYGLVGYKVHSKVCLITRRKAGQIRHTVQIGTGNYNERTARQYTDLSLITADPDIGADAAAFFSNLLLGNLEGRYRRLWVAPGSFKSEILRRIEGEASAARSGQSGRITIKCNSLTDKEIIEALADASQAGVKISLIVRGICCLIPRVPGVTENIRVISVVGKFLEHSRIFRFGTGAGETLAISSADLMTRNTQRRVEVACPILDPALRARLSRMLDLILRDDARAWELHADGRYLPLFRPDGRPSVHTQELFAAEAREAAQKAVPEDPNGPEGARPGRGGPSLPRRLASAVQGLFRKPRPPE